MKKIKSNFITLTVLTLGSWILILSSCCPEVGPDINFDETDLSLIDTNYIELPAESPQQKVVLMEDFTGATCPNCPNATTEIETIAEAHPGQIAVTADFNYPSDPHADGAYNFLTAEAFDLADFLGGTIAWPATAIDRNIFAGETEIILTNEVANYNTYVTERLAEIPPCNMYLTSTYNEETKELLIKVTIKYTSTVTVENHISMALTESGIIDYQTVSGVGEVADYEHNNVLRAMISNTTGDILDNAVDKIPGRVFEKEFKITVENEWVKENLQVVAYVHNFIDDKEVLQACVLDID